MIGSTKETASNASSKFPSQERVHQLLVAIKAKGRALNGKGNVLRAQENVIKAQESAIRTQEAAVKEASQASSLTQNNPQAQLVQQED